MKPYKIKHTQSRLFETRLSDQLNPKRALFQLANQIDWQYFDKEFETLFTDSPGQPPKPIRLIMGSLHTKKVAVF